MSTKPRKKVEEDPRRNIIWIAWLRKVCQNRGKYNKKAKKSKQR
jgi:hypothetical protein